MTSDTFINHFNETISEEGRNLVVIFFITFSRFECALKSTITFVNGNNRKVELNWDTFINSIRNEFNYERTNEFKESIDFILNSPHKIQILNDNNLTWTERSFSPNISNLIKLGLHIRDIRNNLFHGGKFNENYEQDVLRNYRLINSSTIILNEWLNLNEQVQRNFLKTII